MTRSALEGIRVLDLSRGIAGPFAARILGDLGADVIRVEPEQSQGCEALGSAGSAEVDSTIEDALLPYLNWNKRSLCLDIASPGNRESLRALVVSADILIESFRPGYLASLGLDYAVLSQWNPSLVMVSVTPFGQTGPYSGLSDSDLVLQAMGGIMQISGRVDLPPLKHGLDQAYFCGGLNAAYIALACYYASTADGVGEHVDLSLQEVLASELVLNQPLYTFTGAIQGRRAVVQDPFAGEPIEAKDGYVSFQTGGGAPIETLAEVLGDERFRAKDYANGVFRIQNAEQIKTQVSDCLRDSDARDVFLKASEKRLLAGFVQKASDLLSCPQLAARNFFVEIEDQSSGPVRLPGYLFRMSEVGPKLTRPAPRLGQHTAEILKELADIRTGKTACVSAVANVGRLPLEGVRVIDLSTVFAVPYLGAILGDLGAEVIKIEAPNRVDQSRKPTAGPYLDNNPGDEPWNVSGIFHVINRAKKSIAIDLSKPEGLAILRDLVSTADIMLENFTPRVLRKWGLDYESLKQINPKLILLSNTGYGQTGPWANFPSQGTTLEATMGIANYTGYRGDKPWKVGQSYPDFLACWSGLIGVFAALVYRRRTGKPQSIDVSMYEVGVCLVGSAILNYQRTASDLERVGNESDDFVPGNLYPAAGEDQWVAISVKTDQQWKQLAALVADKRLLDDPSLASLTGRRQKRDLINSVLAQWTSSRSKMDLMRTLQQHGIACGPVLNARELLFDPHLRERGFYEVVDHGSPIGKKPLIGRPYKLLNRKPSIRSRAPRFGEHGREILQGLLGYLPERVNSLYETGVVHDRPVTAYRSDPLPLKAMMDLKVISDLDEDYAKAISTM